MFQPTTQAKGVSKALGPNRWAGHASRLGLWIGTPAALWVALGVMVLLAAVLRFYRLADLTFFLGDEARDASIVQSMVEGHGPVLLGPIASVGTYHRGPAYYYLLLLPQWLGGGNPVSGAVAIALIDLGTIVMLFVVGRAFFSTWVGLAASGLWLSQPLVVAFARAAWNPNPLPFFVLLMLYAMFKIARGKSAYLLLLAGAWAISWQLHDETLLLLPVFALFALWFRPRIPLKHYLGAVGVMMAALSPFLLYEVQHGFANTGAMIRFALQSQSGGAPAGVGGMLATMGHRLSQALAVLGNLLMPRQAPADPNKLLLPSQDIASYIFLAVAVVGLGWPVFQARGPNRRSAQLFLLYLLTVLLYAFWPGAFDPHYLAIVWPVPFLLIGLTVDALRRLRLAMGAVSMAAVLLVSLSGAYQQLQLMRDASPGPGTYAATRAVVEHIAATARAKPFGFQLFSSFQALDVFDAPYKYLFEWLNYKPSNSPHADIFIVYDPQAIRDGPALPGVVIDGIKVVHYGPSTEGPNIVRNGDFSQEQEQEQASGPWLMPAPDMARTETSGGRPALLLIGTQAGGVVVNATQRLSVAGGKRYVVRFRYRNQLTEGAQSVYLQFTDAQGNTQGIYPNRAEYPVGSHPEWGQAEFVAEAPPAATQASLCLCNGGVGKAWFADIEVRELILPAEPLVP